MCKFFLCSLTWCTHTITHAHVQRVFSRQSSLEKTTTNKAPPLNHNSRNHHCQAEAAQQPRHYLTIFDVSNNEILFFFFSFPLYLYMCVYFNFFFSFAFQILFTCFFFFFWLKRHKRSTNRTVQRSTHEWIDSVASDSNTATNQFYISPPRKYSKYKLYTCTHIRTDVCVCATRMPRAESSSAESFLLLYIFRMGVYIHVRVRV